MNVCPYLPLRFPKHFSLSGFPTKILYAFLSPLRSKRRDLSHLASFYHHNNIWYSTSIITKYISRRVECYLYELQA